MINPNPQTHYAGPALRQDVETRTLSVLVDNEPGVLARVIGLFSGRGYNIDSLTVTETEHEKHLSRITIITRGTPAVLEQIKHQLERLVPIHRVRDLTSEGVSLERELALAVHSNIDAPVDLLIRTSHELRLSNFLLYQLAYSEMIFTETLWPDFTPKEFSAILDRYSGRDRRFGGAK